MDRVKWHQRIAETEPDPNVNYAIFEAKMNQKRAGVDIKRHKDGQKMKRRRPNPATIIIVIQ